MNQRLGYLVPDFPTQTHVFFWREIRALRQMGQEVFLVSTRKPSVPCRHEFASSAMTETHYLYPPSIGQLTTWITSRYQRIASGIAYFAELESNGIRNRAQQVGLLIAAIDLVQWASKLGITHVHGHSCANSAHVLAIAHRLGGPTYSLTLHGDLEVYGGDHRTKMKDAAFVCAVGSHLAHQIREKLGIPNAIVTCMGVNTGELSKLGNDRTYLAGSLDIATVARLHPAKGHFYALAAVKRALQSGLQVSYTIAGEGPHREDILSKVEELGLEKHVILTGSLSETDVYQLLSKVDAFLLPSTGLGEAWPVSVMEAMGAGLPVIASAIGATPEMITTGEDGFLVPQRDEESIWSKLMLLGTDPDARRRIGAAARSTAQRRFDVAATANVLREAVLRTNSKLNGTDRN